jgi:ribonuclease H2 subunit A
MLLGVHPVQVFIDTVGDPERYKAKLQRSFPSLEFTVCPKADALYPVVSAASIVAKVTRDTAIAAVQAQLQAAAAADSPAVALGTGYPGDPNTQAWLAGNLDRVFGFPRLVRFAWDTTARLLEDGAVKVTWEAEGSGDPSNGPGSGGGRAQATLGAFMAGGDASSESSGAGRHVFFRLRRLQRVKAF